MSGRRRFGAADERALSELPTILRQFRELYPRINLELTVTQSSILYRRLMANHLDLVFIDQALLGNIFTNGGINRFRW